MPHFIGYRTPVEVSIPQIPQDHDLHFVATHHVSRIPATGGSMPYRTTASSRLSKLLRYTALAGLLLSALSGCTMVGPDYVKPTVVEPKRWPEENNPALSTRPNELAAWWTTFQDPVLTRLIHMACSENPGLHIAGLRILEARARLAVLVGNQYPQLQQVRGEAGAVGGSKNMANTTSGADFRYGELSVGFDAGWEMDIWGKFRRAVNSGLATLESSVADYDNVLVILTAEVARTYMILATLESRLKIAEENVTIQSRSLQIATVRFEGGDVTELDVAQAKTLLANTQATIPRLQSQIYQVKSNLALLLGRLPTDLEPILATDGILPTIPAEIGIGIPAEMLRRRPDIRQAELQLLAQSERIGIAQADLYPHFSLVGSIGLRTSDSDISAAGFPGGSSFGDLLNSDSFEYFVGPTFSWDILNYGRIKNRVRIEDARFQQLAENYRDTILQAATESETAIVSFLKAREEQQYLQNSADAASRSVTLAMLQYEEGLNDFQRVLETQRALIQQQDLLATNQGDVATNLIAIYKALGGGWETFSNKPVVPEVIRATMEQRTDWGKMLNMDPEVEQESDSTENPLLQPVW